MRVFNIPIKTSRKLIMFLEQVIRAWDSVNEYCLKNMLVPSSLPQEHIQNKDHFFSRETLQRIKIVTKGLFLCTLKISKNQKYAEVLSW